MNWTVSVNKIADKAKDVYSLDGLQIEVMNLLTQDNI